MTGSRQSAGASNIPLNEEGIGPSAASMDMLRSLAERARTAVFVRDVHGRFLLANQPYAALLDQTPELLLERTIAEIFSADDVTRIAAEDQAVIAADHPLISEVVQNSGGITSRHLVAKYPLLDEHGVPAGVAGIITDITGDQEAEPGLDFNLQHFQYAFDQAPIGACIIGLDLCYLRVNRALCRLTGYNEAELLRHGGLDLTHPNDVAAEMHAVLQLISGETEETALEKRYLRPDGSVIWANLHLRLVRSPAGKPLYYLAFAEDITVYKQLVATLQEREVMLSSLGDNLPDTVIYQVEEQPDGSTRRTYQSRGLAHRTGISPEQSLKENMSRRPFTIHPEDVPGYEAALQAARASFTHFDHEFRYIAADGSVRWLRMHSSPRRLDNGRILRDGIAIDTTENRWLQESLRQANLRLNRRVDELSLLNQIARLLSGVTDLPETLEVVCHLLRGTFHAVDVLVALREHRAAGLQIVARQVDPQAAEAQPPDLNGDRLARHAIERGGAIIEDTPGEYGGSTLTIPLRARNDLIGLLRIVVRSPSHSLTPDNVSLAQTIAGAIAVAAATARLYAQAVHDSERLERLNAASRMINGAGLDLPALYAAIHRAVAHLMPVEAFVISLVEPESELAEHVYNYDRIGLCGPGRTPLAQSFAAFMRRHGPTLRVADFAAYQPLDVAFQIYGDGEDTRSGLAASFVTADGLYGLLFAQAYPPDVYSDNDLTILELLAAHAATAIENARRAQQARRDAIDEERNRLARDLHDSVSQSLFSAGMIAERLPAMARINPAEAWEGLELLNQLVRGALVEMRALLIELRPAALADAPLHLAIDQLTRAFAGRRSIPIVTSLDPAPRLPQAVQTALYRIVQEGVSNVIKHAHARSASVCMRVEPAALEPENAWQGTVTLQISDDGRGFQLEQIGPARFGIGIMHERAATIGARLTIISRPNQGTCLELTWSGHAREEGS